MALWSERGFPYHPLDLGRLRDPEAARQALLRVSRPGPHRYFVATEGGRAVGRVTVNLTDAAGLYLWAVHVPPEHEGKGIARRMLAGLMEWLEGEIPGVGFVLTANTFALRAHRTYTALGFRVEETRWHFDHEIAERLWNVSRREREALGDHLRFHAGQWQVRTYLMRRAPGTQMSLAVSREGPDP
ncbi:MAG: GNAT family N-acetyltransferase [Dehalococcoidia bacterium]